MKKNKLLLLGAGGHARACIDVIESENRFEIAGLVGQVEEVGRHVSGYEVLGCDEQITDFARQYKWALVVVGQIYSPKTRIALLDKVINAGFSLATIISPWAYVSRSARIGHGTIVMHGAIVNANANIGENCIINSNALVEHDCIVESNCHISTGAILNGGVQVGEGCFVGSGSSIREETSIGDFSIVGMGQAVHKNLDKYSKLTQGNCK